MNNSIFNKCLIFLSLLFVLGSCNIEKTIDREAVKQEVADTEKAFNDYAAQHGVKEAFLAFADEEAV